MLDVMFSVASLTSTIFCMGLGAYVLSLNRSSKLNQIFFVTIFSGFLYTFTTVLMWMSPSPESAFLWHKAGTMWPFFVAAVLHFALIFTDSKWIKSKFHVLAIYVPAIALWLVDLTTDYINTPPILKYWGYNDQVSSTSIYYISTLWSALLPLVAFAICLRYFIKAKEPSQRQRAKLVSIGFVIPIICFIATNMVGRTLNIDIPNLGPFSTFFLSLFVGYAISKYDLFTIDSVLAAENLAATLPGSLIITNHNGQILKVNDNFVTVSGYSRGELIGQNIGLFGGQSVETVNAFLDVLSKSKQIRDREVEVQTKNGETRYVLLTGSLIQNRSNRPLGFTFIFNDITERKNAEKELANTKNYLETLLNSMLTGVLVINANSHRVEDVNTTALSMLGLRREEVIGRVCHRFLCPTDEGKCPITDLGFNIHNDEKILLTVNGEQKQILKSVTKLQLNDKLLLIENFIDISQRKTIEAQLVKAQRLASIGELAGQLGHDLRNPLAGIKNGVYLVRKKYNRMTDEEREEILRIIDVAVEDSNRIVSSLIEYSSELLMMPDMCTPKVLVASALEKLQVPPRIYVENEALDETNMLLDSEYLGRVFVAILQNSIQAMPESGTLTTKTRIDGSDMVFSFSDTGMGIPQDLLPNIFNPLVTTKAKGMGMGLAISKRVVEAHGGKITLQSQVGAGTTVEIILPITLSRGEFDKAINSVGSV
jgi:PAS domain S-box-containing protein